MKKRKFGSAKGEFEVPEDFNEPMNMGICPPEKVKCEKSIVLEALVECMDNHISLARKAQNKKNSDFYFHGGQAIAYNDAIDIIHEVMD